MEERDTHVDYCIHTHFLLENSPIEGAHSTVLNYTSAYSNTSTLPVVTRKRYRDSLKRHRHTHRETYEMKKAMTKNNMNIVL
jgi:hypothetical protein